MLGRALIGAVAATITLFILGFLFFATPLHDLAVRSLPDEQAASVQASLAQNLPGTATYAIPSNATAQQTVLYGRGPIATVHYNTDGFAISDPGTMFAGVIHMLIVSLLMAAGLAGITRYVPAFGERVGLLLLGVLSAAIFMRLGVPIWYHHDWAHALYLFIADTTSLSLAGFIILKLLAVSARAAAPAEAPTDV